MKILVSILCIIHASSSFAADYEIGIGRADCTGPVAEIGFMGYAKASQKGGGLHLRQFARAFIIKDGTNSIVFVSVDVGMIGNALRDAVIKRISKDYGNLYNNQNVIISGTHTHSAPGGFLLDLLFDISILGFVRQTFEALEFGIANAIKKAHKNLQPGNVFWQKGMLLNANINRSPHAYLLNPEHERTQYEHNVDTEMVQLQFRSKDLKPLGVINWFPVHPTSMNNTNTLVSSDNVGYASILFEQEINKDLPGKGSFVAAFASSNLGDVSPNIQGPRCLNTGKKCDDVHSSCDGDAKYCVAFGPGKDMFDSTKIIAERLYKKAMDLFISPDRKSINGPVLVKHQYVDMPKQEVDYEWPNGTHTKVKGCVPAMGYSFAAGTTDGPGEFDFKQGTTTTNPLWIKIRDFIAPPTKEDEECQSPKPILLATGRIKYPYEWQPSIVSTQLAFIGDFAIAAVPGEFTTMAGRRLRKAISKTAKENNFLLQKVVVAGLCNVYSDYITTLEEYQLQRYEAASTIYGPHTLTIYLDVYSKLTKALLGNDVIENGPTPPIVKNPISLIPPVILDTPWYNNKFGSCVVQPPPDVKKGSSVTVTFVAGHPRNRLLHGKTFLTIEKKVGINWTVIANDANWETKFVWFRLLGSKSGVNITWDIGENIPSGTYRIKHFGNYKYLFSGIHPYEGVTKSFNVT